MVTISRRSLSHSRITLSTCIALGCLLTAATFVAPCAFANDDAEATISLIADGDSNVTSGNVVNGVGNALSPDDLMQRLDQVTKRLGKLEKSTPAPVWLMTPGLNSNVPSAYGAGKGITGVGFGFQERTRFSKKSDGTAAVVLGFGDPEKIGFDLQLNELDLSDLGNRESVSVKFHKQLKNDFAVALGAENLIVHGFTDGERSFYAVVSKKLRLKESSREPFSRVYLSGGLGSGRFRSERNVRTDTGTLNFFGSAAVNLSPWAIVFTEWTGQGLNIGASFVPFKTVPLVITPALADIAGPAGDGTRFTLGVGYLVKY